MPPLISSYLTVPPLSFIRVTLVSCDLSFLRSVESRLISPEFIHAASDEEAVKHSFLKCQEKYRCNHRPDFNLLALPDRRLNNYSFRRTHWTGNVNEAVNKGRVRKFFGFIYKYRGNWKHSWKILIHIEMEETFPFSSRRKFVESYGSI